MAPRYGVLRVASRSTEARLLLAGLVVAFLAGCGGDGSASGGSPTGGGPVGAPAAPTAPGSVQVNDVTGKPISGAVVTAAAAGVQVQATANAAGVAQLSGVPTGEVSVTVAAPSFESEQFTTRLSGASTSITLKAAGEWAIGRAFVLNSRMLDRAPDGSTLTFTADVAVIDANRAAIQNLASSDFQVEGIDCGWGGPRDCATDAEGNAPPSGGHFRPDGGAESFGLQPPSARRPYVAGIVVERSLAMRAWPEIPPALRKFFQTVGGNDAASLATVSVVNSAAITEVLGGYSSSGLPLLPIIDQLAPVAKDSPALLQAIQDAIQRAAAARNSVTNGAEPYVVMLANGGLSPAQFTLLGGIARQAGVRIGAVVSGELFYGLTELATRSGGFVAPYSDPRQLSQIFAALDSVLAGSQPFYRMTFRVKGAPGTFVAGGNAKIWLVVRVPAPMPSRGVWAQFDVPIT
jgi:hypothetical protein